jgi:hypothetical protein
VLAQLLAVTGSVYLPSMPLGAFAQAAAAAVGGSPLKRQALVLGNSAYRPDRNSIPSARKNTVDVANSLKKLGFEVRQDVDLGAQPMRALVQDFFGRLRADRSSRALAVFYYTGHGIQHRGEGGQSQNFIVPSDVALDQRIDAIARASINIDRDVLGQESLPNDGTAVLIFDACRNEPGKDAADRTGSFNQVNPPAGTIITFSTAPGRYAIAPRSPDENSIYTRILVQELEKANPDISIKDFLDSVKFEVRRYMSTHEEPFLRKHAQDPEVAANLRLRMSLALEKAPPPVDDREDKAWAAIEQTVVPAERVKLLQAFVSEFKDSRFAQAARTQLERAIETEAATRRNAVQVDAGIGDTQFREDQKKGLDGDKDAAYRVALMFRDGTNGAPRDDRKMIQWLRHASELKSGIASYALYVYYRDRQMDREAVRYENLAVAQGYTLPMRVASGR